MHTETPSPTGQAPDPIDPASGLKQSQIDKELARRDAIAGANADPLPGPLAEAFDPEPITVGEFTVRPYVPFDMVVLRKIGSPLLRQMQEMNKPEEERTGTDYGDEEEFEMIFQFITPVEVVRDLIRQGRQAFKDAAWEKVANNPKLNAVLHAQLTEAVTTQFLRAFSTVLSYGGGQAGEETPFPTRQPAAPATDSAGG